MIYRAVVRKCDGVITVRFPDVPTLKIEVAPEEEGYAETDMRLRSMLAQWLSQEMEAGRTPRPSRGELLVAFDERVIDVPVPLTLAAKIAIRQRRVVESALTIEEWSCAPSAPPIQQLRALEDPSEPLILSHLERAFEGCSGSRPQLSFVDDPIVTFQTHLQEDDVAVVGEVPPKLAVRAEWDLLPEHAPRRRPGRKGKVAGASDDATEMDPLAGGP